MLVLVNGAVVGGSGGLVHGILQHRASAPGLDEAPRDLSASIAVAIVGIAAGRVLERENGWLGLGVLVVVVLALRSIARRLLARRRSPRTR
jgi:hypothetical protein